ncbi:MAG TPA: glycosyltransferase family 4 protein [Candidatus Wunengus sp. YC65]|uniref:glycosyltransferase family 4 protein n=1 Tax=Candidatus Wunengus sp. YC65 TaxID=3367701 RepID=UPI004029CAEC
MILGIDASNIRGGGGVTHLIELLRAADPMKNGFSRVIVWSGQATLSKIEDRPWLVKSYQSMLDKGLLCRTLWQYFRVSRLARVAGCDVLLVPGGSYFGDFQPMVAVSQNLLPFEWCELRRFGWSWMTLKLVLLRITQSRTFRRADGLIFLTRYARDVVMQVIKTPTGKTMIVPHGIDERFVCSPREQLAINRYTVDRPYRILYVSTIDVYKHQWRVAEALARLRESGLPVVLDLVGPAYPPALKKLRKTLDRIDPAGEFVRYWEVVPYAELHTLYAQADLCLFASSCENMPNILLEGMASGLPIACSSRGPMPEVLGDAGVYFDPENAQEIALALRNLIKSPELRSRIARASFSRAQVYFWARCARETFEFLTVVASDARLN